MVLGKSVACQATPCAQTVRTGRWPGSQGDVSARLPVSLTDVSAWTPGSPNEQNFNLYTGIKYFSDTHTASNFFDRVKKKMKVIQ